MNNEKIILFDSDEAAQPITLSGWQSSDGFFFRDESSARYRGCTHKICDCGKPMSKFYTKCESCRFVSQVEKYDKLPFKEWDGVTPLCIYQSDEYFFNENDIWDYIDNHSEDDDEIKPEDLMLVICEPNYYAPIVSDVWEDIIPEDGDIPKIIQEKLAEFNEFLKKQPPLSWSQGKFRTIFKS